MDRVTLEKEFQNVCLLLPACTRIIGEQPLIEFLKAGNLFFFYFIGMLNGRQFGCEDEIQVIDFMKYRGEINGEKTICVDIIRCTINKYVIIITTGNLCVKTFLEIKETYFL